ncbi:MAG: TIGR01906 family membrane protein [Clostridiales bacterium]|nr:TIGR01906 family membrane protein [Clostridiales bacterium]
MNKGWAIIISIIFSILLAVHVLISFITFVGLNPEIYKSAQLADDVALNAELDQETLDLATIGLIDYMDGRRDDLVIMSSAQEGHELFNSKEKAHMVDVKNLFILSKRINKMIYVILLLILIFYLGYDKEGMKKYFMKYCAITLTIVLGLWLIIAILAMIDFSSFWTTFHKVFFTNDLWMLNPSTDLLIRMMPQRFFTRIVIHILIRFMASYAIVLAVLATGHVLVNKKKLTASAKGRKNA